MHIGVDATSWQNARGYGRYLRALLRAMVSIDSENRYTLFLDSQEGAADLPAGTRTRVLGASKPAAVAAAANGRRSLTDMWMVSRAMSAEKCDLLLFPTIYTYVPVFTRAKKLVVIHDVIAETHPALTLPTPAARLFWKAKVAAGRMQADALVTVSDYSREGIVRRFGVDPGRVFVVGEASDPVFRPLPGAVPTPQLAAMGIASGRRMVTYVGGFSPHKNLDVLLSAFAAVAARPGFEDALLVMVGEHKKEVFLSCFGALTKQVEALGLQDRVVFTGYLPDEELVVLLNLSSVLALPSLMEGFGLPAMEAAACGCPVVATTASPLPGLLGEGGLFIEPTREALEDALGRVLGSESLRRRMSRAALSAASRLTWEISARRMLGVIEEVASQ